VSWDSVDFPGLSREFDAYSNYRIYSSYDDIPINEPDVNSGTHSCPSVDPISGNPTTVQCPNEGTLEAETTYDSSQGRYVVFGPFPEDQTLADRALTPPTPAFVQVQVSAGYTTEGGANTCTFPGCSDPVDGELHFDATCATASFEAGGDETTGTQDLTLVDGVVFDEVYAGMLRRPIDGDSYLGNPTNDASRTLIPWAEYIAAPVATLTATAQNVQRLRQNQAGTVVTPWYLPAGAPVQSPEAWIIGSV
jgi:hypothetical protein